MEKCSYFRSQRYQWIALDSLLDKQVTLKKFTKYEIRFKNKPWITSAIKKAIQNKNQLFSQYIKSKNLNIKNVFHEKYKYHRNLLSTLMKKSKSDYYTNFFTKNNIKNII